MPVFFATAAKGTEGALRDELRQHRFRGVRADRGGVRFEGALSEGHRACLELRCAVRVLLELARFAAPDEGCLYDGVASIDWSTYLDETRTLAVRASCRSSHLTHTQFIAQKTKDAVVDQLRERNGARPNVDRDDPDVGIFVHLVRDEATLYLDVSGRSLHLRGYRLVKGEAPLKETLAAALVRLSGWDGQRRFVDPMCGSGTIAIEAAMVARDVPPGLVGGPFGFERWLSYDESAARNVSDLRAEARGRAERAARLTVPEVVAMDVDEAALRMTEENARRAGVELIVERASVASLRSESPICVVTNPPYGERLDLSREDARAMGTALAGLRGSRVAMLAHGPELLRAMPMRSTKELTVFNGDLECRFALYDP
jgi:putative N6-adenine-specific DNA methylase